LLFLAGGCGLVKNKCIVLLNGTIIAPASLETPDGVWQCFTDSSLDQGRTWQRSPLVPIARTKLLGEGAIQPLLIEDLKLPLGKCLCLLEVRPGSFYTRDSDNSGQSWGEMYETRLFNNNNSGLDAIKLEDGRWVVVHNPAGRNWVCIFFKAWTAS
jgi:predicted neuraminidase